MGFSADDARRAVQNQNKIKQEAANKEAQAREDKLKVEYRQLRSRVETLIEPHMSKIVESQYQNAEQINSYALSSGSIGSGWLIDSYENEKHHSFSSAYHETRTTRKYLHISDSGNIVYTYYHIKETVEDGKERFYEIAQAFTIDLEKNSGKKWEMTHHKGEDTRYYAYECNVQYLVEALTGVLSINSDNEQKNKENELRRNGGVSNAQPTGCLLVALSVLLLFAWTVL